jgi:CBS domain containing-hemolysin-like protein
VAGYILERMGRVPEAGESLEADGLRFEVLAATPTRIDRVSVERLDHAEGGVDVAAGEVG